MVCSKIFKFIFSNSVKKQNQKNLSCNKVTKGKITKRQKVSETYNMFSFMLSVNSLHLLIIVYLFLLHFNFTLTTDKRQLADEYEKLQHSKPPPKAARTPSLSEVWYCVCVSRQAGLWEVDSTCNNMPLNSSGFSHTGVCQNATQFKSQLSAVMFDVTKRLLFMAKDRGLGRHTAALNIYLALQTNVRKVIPAHNNRCVN